MDSLNYGSFDNTNRLVEKFYDDVERHMRERIGLSAQETLSVAIEMAKLYHLEELNKTGLAIHDKLNSLIQNVDSVKDVMKSIDIGVGRLA